MDAEEITKSSQEQAVASWINYLNQVRLDRLMEALTKEQDNLENAMGTIKETLDTISKDIVNNGLGRGGKDGMHGFIAEVAECGIENARSQIEGELPICRWIDDNGSADLCRGELLIQQKFVNAGNHLSLQAIQEHLEHYPNFLNEGGVYQIPADHYDKINYLLSISKEEANKMPTSTGEFSLKQWREVHDFFEKGDVSLESIEPSALEYKSVHRNTYEDTLNAEKQSLQERNEERRVKAYQDSKPTLEQGLKSTAVAAAVEGGMTFIIDIAKKRKEGKKFKDFDGDDWKEIAGDTGWGVVKGGVRGLSVYVLTNFTATPAAVASAIVTASLGIAEQAHMFRQGKIDELSFIENSEMLCLNAAVSALSSFAGQVLIPIPVLGAVFGNAVGTMLYKISKDNLSAKEQKMIEKYLKEIGELSADLQKQYKAFLDELSDNMKLFMSILDRAFAPDIRIAFAGSIELAKQIGVPEEEILDTKEKIVSYFMD